MSERTNHTNIGELITTFCAEYLEIYGDRELAAMATAATINELLLKRPKAKRRAQAA